MPKEIKNMYDGSVMERLGDAPAAPGVKVDGPHGLEPSPLPRSLAGQPTLWRPDWLPEGLFPEIDALRAEHLEHLKAPSEAGDAVQALIEAWEAEDRARENAMRLGGEVPAVTPTAERQDAFNTAEAERHAAMARFVDFITRAEAVFAAKEAEWRGNFAALAAGAEHDREEARAALAQADQEVARIAKLTLWLDRTIKPRGGRYESAPDLTPIDPGAQMEAVA